MVVDFEMCFFAAKERLSHEIEEMDSGFNAKVFWFDVASVRVA